MVRIKNYYKESNEISDISGDYRIVTMSVSFYSQLMKVLMDSKINGNEKELAKIVIETLDEAISKSKAEWY